MPKMKKLTVLSLLATGMSSMTMIPAIAQAEDAFMEALTGGKVSFSARARYENVDQDGIDKAVL